MIGVGLFRAPQVASPFVLLELAVIVLVIVLDQAIGILFGSITITVFRFIVAG